MLYDYCKTAKVSFWGGGGRSEFRSGIGDLTECRENFCVEFVKKPGFTDYHAMRRRSSLRDWGWCRNGKRLLEKGGGEGEAAARAQVSYGKY